MKYKLTEETKEFEGHTLHRIECIESFGDVNKGDKGGWIENVCEWLSEHHFLPSDGYYCYGKLIAEELREELGIDKHEDNRDND